MAEDVNKEVKEAEERAKAAEAAAEEARKEADRLAKKAKEEAEKQAEEAKKAEDDAKKAEEAKKAAEAKEAEAKKKAEEEAAKAAAVASAAAAEAARKQQEAAAEKDAKKKEKLEKVKALKASCPPEYKPVGTSTFFWTGILCWLPFIGFFITLILSLAPKNRNLKNFARSKLAYYIIILISCLIITLVAGAVIPEDNRIEIGNALLKIFRSLGLNV